MTSRLKDVPKRFRAPVSTSGFSSTRFWVTRTSGISSLIFFISGFAVFVSTCFFCFFQLWGHVFVVFPSVLWSFHMLGLKDISTFSAFGSEFSKVFWFSFFWCSVLDIIRVYIL